MGILRCCACLMMLGTINFPKPHLIKKFRSEKTFLIHFPKGPLLNRHAMEKVRLAPKSFSFL